MRRLLATLLALLACLVLPLAVLAAWLGTVVDDTDRYVETVGPLATDAAVVEAVESSLVQRTMTTLDDTVPLDAQTRSELQPVVATGVRAVVESEQFRPAWEAANADAHRQLLAQLRASGSGAGDDVVLDFGSVLASVVDEVGGSLPVTLPTPDVAVPLTVLSGEQVVRARAAYDALDALRVLAPLAWVVLVVLALLVSPRRPRTLAVLGVGSLVTLGLLLLGLARARDRVVAQVAAADRALSAVVWDEVTRSLDLVVYAGLAVAVVLVAVGALGGAVRGRRTA